ncbi:MAG: hypothetical protein QME81_00500 [bacterium]|nr:hypothetical protein [bacterium]
MKAGLFLSIVLIVGICCGPVYAAGEEGKITLDQRMIRLEIMLEERFKAIDQRFEAIDQRFEAIDQRFEAVNQRIDDMKSSVNQRFDDLRFWLQTIIGVLALILGGMAAQWILMWRRLVKVEAVQEEHQKVHVKEEESNRLVELIRLVGRLEKRMDRMEEQQLPVAV